MKEHVWEMNPATGWWVCKACGLRNSHRDSPDSYKQYGKSRGDPYSQSGDPLMGDPRDCNEAICMRILES